MKATIVLSLLLFNITAYANDHTHASRLTQDETVKQASVSNTSSKDMQTDQSLFTLTVKPQLPLNVARVHTLAIEKGIQLKLVSGAIDY